MIITYYQGLDRPTILFKLGRTEGVDRLREAVASGRDAGESISLKDLPDVHVVDIDGLDVFREDRDTRPRLGRRQGGSFFWWSCDPEQWQTVYDLLEPLTRESSHRYLSGVHGDAALVGVSVGEPDVAPTLPGRSPV